MNDHSVGEFVRIDKLHPHHKNPRHNDHAVDSIANSIKRFGFTSPIIANKDGTILAGHTRWKSAKKLGLDTVPVVYVDLSPVDAELLMIADNKLGEKADWNTDQLSSLLMDLKEQGEDLDVLGFEQHELDELLEDLDADLFGDGEPNSSGTIVKTFGAPPFSVLDSRQGYWITRKRFWLDFGIQSYKGRDAFDDNHTVSSKSLDDTLGIKYKGGGSVFDPVLCELFYTWFNVPKGSILDPFAGGSVRGLVASALGYQYFGHELRSEQVESNKEQYMQIGSVNEWLVEPKYIVGDSAKTISEHNEKVDLIFTCPPYAFLEVYSDDPNDLSNMPYEDFIQAYRKVIKDSCERLNDNRFAVFVVGEVRAKNGSYVSFVPNTIRAFTDAGMSFYNEIIYVTQVGTVALSAPKVFKSGRKIGKVHQNILVFYKGDPKKANDNWRDIEINILDIDLVDE